MPSSVAKHTIPPFYACYFLRSLSSPGITYIGSTPAPPRRKRQHNGDLTQGAYKTARSRPWEMECIVYGFSSKIAALQFEWAWAKPHLSRHLKFLSFEYSADGMRADTPSAMGLPLFPSTSMTLGQTRWGKPKRRMARPPSTPNARLLAMRALLRSEPFCGWGLKLAFFTEWSWLAYQRLEHAALSSAELLHSSDLPGQVSIPLVRRSRSGKPLHPLYPLAVCDFAGVDGKRNPLVHLPAQDLIYAGVAEQPIKKRQSSSNKKAAGEDETPHWAEMLPRSANLKGLDACTQDFVAFPTPSPAHPNTDLTHKAKRITKASKEAVSDDQDPLDADDPDACEAEERGAQMNSEPTRVMHRMRFDDLNAEESEWKKLEHTIATRLGPSTADTKQAMSDFMQTCVQRHVAAQDTQTLDTAPPAPTLPCALCNELVDVTNQLGFVLCANPPSSTPTEPSAVSNAKALIGIESHPCSSVFHVPCLADSFLQQQQANGPPEGDVHCTTNTILPTHGVCPCRTGKTEAADVALWADVVRGMYRRHERFERLVQFLARSGRTLIEHLTLPEPLPASPRKKKASQTQATNKAVTDDVVSPESEAADPGKKAKQATVRKKRQAAKSVASEAIEEVQHQGNGGETASGTKRRVSRKRKAAAGPIDVIDLT